LKINFEKVYEDRIIEIDTQIKMAIHKKYWGIKTSLECEKKKLLKTLEIMKHKKCI